MRYLLDQFPSILASDIQTLTSLDITNTDQLLDQAAMPSARESLARQSGISFERLTRLAGLADLVRIKGIGPAVAEVFVDAGAAGNVQQLAERSTDLPALRQAIISYLTETGIRARFVSLHQLGEICAESHELRPRLLLQTLKPDPQFRRDLFNHAWTERKHSFKLSLGMFTALLVPIAILAVVAHFLSQTWIQEDFSPYEDINWIYLSVEQIRLGLLDRSALSMMLILVVMLFALIIAYDTVSYLQATWLVLFLFSTFSQQEFYKWVNSIDLKKQIRAMWWVVALLAGVGLVLVAIAINSLINSSAMGEDTLYKIFPEIIIPGGILMGIVASLPILKFFLKGPPQKMGNNQEHIQRYFVYYMSKVMMLPIMVVLFTQVVMPSAFSIHTGVMKARFIPQAQFEILEKKRELVEMQSDDTDKLIWRDYALLYVDNMILSEIDTQALVITPEDTSAMDVLIPVALNMVVWLAMTALLLLFVVPYLILGGWGRGLFYIFILGISFALENQLTIIAPTWFMLSQDSISQGPFIAFFVLINALFFDWLFEVFTNRKKICPSCKTELDQKTLFCSECGYEQE